MSAFFGCRMMITMTHTFVCNFPCNLKEQWIIHVSLWHMFCWGGKKRRKEKITIEWEKIGKRPVFKQSLLLFSNSLSHAHTTLAHKKAKRERISPFTPSYHSLPFRFWKYRIWCARRRSSYQVTIPFWCNLFPHCFGDHLLPLCKHTYIHSILLSCLLPNQCKVIDMNKIKMLFHKWKLALVWWDRNKAGDIGLFIRSPQHLFEAQTNNATKHRQVYPKQEKLHPSQESFLICLSIFSCRLDFSSWCCTCCLTLCIKWAIKHKYSCWCIRQYISGRSWSPWLLQSINIMHEL